MIVTFAEVCWCKRIKKKIKIIIIHSVEFHEIRLQMILNGVWVPPGGVSIADLWYFVPACAP